MRITDFICQIKTLIFQGYSLDLQLNFAKEGKIFEFVGGQNTGLWGLMVISLATVVLSIFFVNLKHKPVFGFLQLQMESKIFV